MAAKCPKPWGDRGVFRNRNFPISLFPALVFSILFLENLRPIDLASIIIIFIFILPSPHFQPIQSRLKNHIKKIYHCTQTALSCVECSPTSSELHPCPHPALPRAYCSNLCSCHPQSTQLTCQYTYWRRNPHWQLSTYKIDFTLSWFMFIRYSSSLMYFSRFFLLFCYSACRLRYSEYCLLSKGVIFSLKTLPMTA